MAGTLTIVAHVRAKRGMHELMVAEQLRLVAATRPSPGCLRYELHVSNKDSASVTFVEEWATRDLWLAHMESAHVEAFRAAAGHTIAEFSLHDMHRVG